MIGEVGEAARRWPLELVRRQEFLFPGRFPDLVLRQRRLREQEARRQLRARRRAERRELFERRRRARLERPTPRRNPGISEPTAPGDWVDTVACAVCGESYAQYRSGVRWEDAVAFLRASPAKYRSRGPVLWAMRVMKLERWYAKHAACGVPEEFWDYAERRLQRETGASWRVVEAAVDRTPLDWWRVDEPRAFAFAAWLITRS